MDLTRLVSSFECISRIAIDENLFHSIIRVQYRQYLNQTKLFVLYTSTVWKQLYTKVSLDVLLCVLFKISIPFSFNSDLFIIYLEEED